MKRSDLMKNKRGEALPLNVIIIAIIVIVVLVVVLLIFIGGIAGLQDKFKSKADDSVLAARECENYCSNIQDEKNPEVISRSAYCTKWYKLDSDGDSKVDVGTNNQPIRYYCSGGGSNIPDNMDRSNVGTVGISCPVNCLPQLRSI